MTRDRQEPAPAHRQRWGFGMRRRQKRNSESTPVAPHFHLRKRPLLGKGAVAKVYLCTNKNVVTTKGTSNMKYYAAKVIPKETVKEGIMRKLHRNEIKIHRSLRHPHVCRFRHYYEDEDNCFLVMDLCPNQTLHELLERRQRLTEPETAYYMRQIVHAVHYIHSQKVIHRDLKLANMLLDKDRDVQVADFGLAAIDASTSLLICGTPDFIAPEMLCGDRCSFAVDVWSIGVCLYTMLVGKTPFRGDKNKETYQRILENDYTFPDHLMVSEAAKDLVWSLLQTNPADRLTPSEIAAHPFLSRLNIPPSLPPFTMVSAPSWQRNAQGKLVANSQQQHRVTRDPSSLQKLEPDTTSPKNLPSDAQSHENLRSMPNLPPSLQNPNPVEVWRSARASESRPGGTDSSQGTRLDEATPTAASVAPARWVTRYYTSKFGLAYQLNDGSMGICFNDTTQILGEAVNDAFHYVNGGVSAHTLSQYPKELDEKVRLLQHLRGVAPQVTLDNEKTPDICYMKRWARSEDAIVFILSNDTIQAIFTDQFEIVLTQDINTPARVSGPSNPFPLSNTDQRVEYLQKVLGKMSTRVGDERSLLKRAALSDEHFDDLLVDTRTVFHNDGAIDPGDFSSHDHEQLAHVHDIQEIAFVLGTQIDQEVSRESAESQRNDVEAPTCAQDTIRSEANPAFTSNDLAVKQSRKSNKISPPVPAKALGPSLPDESADLCSVNSFTPFLTAGELGDSIPISPDAPKPGVQVQAINIVDDKQEFDSVFQDASNWSSPMRVINLSAQFEADAATVRSAVLDNGPSSSLAVDTDRRRLAAKRESRRRLAHSTSTNIGNKAGECDEEGVVLSSSTRVGHLEACITGDEMVNEVAVSGPAFEANIPLNCQNIGDSSVPDRLHEANMVQDEELGTLSVAIEKTALCKEQLHTRGIVQGELNSPPDSEASDNVLVMSDDHSSVSMSSSYHDTSVGVPVKKTGGVSSGRDSAEQRTTATTHPMFTSTRKCSSWEELAESMSQLDQDPSSSLDSADFNPGMTHQVPQMVRFKAYTEGLSVERGELLVSLCKNWERVSCQAIKNVEESHRNLEATKKRAEESESRQEELELRVVQLQIDRETLQSQLAEMTRSEHKKQAMIDKSEEDLDQLRAEVLRVKDRCGTLEMSLNRKGAVL